MSRKAIFKDYGGAQNCITPNERKEYDQLLCWYCGKSRRVWPPNGCTLTHKSDPLKDAMYPEHDPYKSNRAKDGKIIRPPPCPK